MKKIIEYRVRTGIRYFVTRYERNENGAGCATVCECDNWEQAINLGKKLAVSEPGATYQHDGQGESRAPTLGQ